PARWLDPRRAPVRGPRLAHARGRADRLDHTRAPQTGPRNRPALARPVKLLNLPGPIYRRRLIMSELTGLRVAVLATDGFEEPELTEPVKALKEAGAQVTIVSPRSGEIQGVRHDIDRTIKVKVDRTIDEVSAAEFDAVHIPGGTLNA